jgi:chromosome segregation ATPase
LHSDPVTPPQSTTNTVSEEDREGPSEEQAQEQQERVDEQEKWEKSTQKIQQGDTAISHQLDGEALITQLNEAKEKSTNLEKQIEEKDVQIDRLQKRIKTANASRLGAIDKNKLSEAEEFRKQYGKLRDAYNELEKEKDELEKQLKTSRADVKRLELALQDSQIEVQSLTTRLRIKDEELEDAYNRRSRTRDSASAIPMSNLVSNE